MAHEMIRAVGLQATDFTRVMGGHILDRLVRGFESIESYRLEAVNFPVGRQLACEVEKVVHFSPQAVYAEDRWARARRLHRDERAPGRRPSSSDNIRASEAIVGD